MGLDEEGRTENTNPQQKISSDVEIVKPMALQCRNRDSWVWIFAPFEIMIWVWDFEKWI